MYGGNETAYKRFRELVRDAKLTARQDDSLWTERWVDINTGKELALYLDFIDAWMLPVF